MTILIIGAAGNVGTALRREFVGGPHRLRLFDRVAIPGLAASEDAVRGDLLDPDGLARAMEGVTAVVHLAGCTTDAGIEEQIDGNIRGAFYVFDAARRAGVDRVVLASTHHVMGYYPRRRRIGTDALLRPDSRYGLTKGFGEQVGAMFADKYGLRVLCIRIGAAMDRPDDRRRLSIWISWRDLAQLVRIGIEAPALRYAVVYGVSGNDRSFFDNETAFRLGYRPQDNAETYAAELLDGLAPEDSAMVGSHVIGGHFPNNEFVGSIGRVDEW